VARTSRPSHGLDAGFRAAVRAGAAARKLAYAVININRSIQDCRRQRREGLAICWVDRTEEARHRIAGPIDARVRPVGQPESHARWWQGITRAGGRDWRSASGHTQIFGGAAQLGPPGRSRPLTVFASGRSASSCASDGRAQRSAGGVLYRTASSSARKPAPSQQRGAAPQDPGTTRRLESRFTV